MGSWTVSGDVRFKCPVQSQPNICKSRGTKTMSLFISLQLSDNLPLTYICSGILSCPLNFMSICVFCFLFYVTIFFLPLWWLWYSLMCCNCVSLRVFTWTWVSWLWYGYCVHVNITSLFLKPWYPVLRNLKYSEKNCNMITIRQCQTHKNRS